MKKALFVTFTLLLSACDNAKTKSFDSNVITGRNAAEYNLIYEKEVGLIWQTDSLVLAIKPNSVSGPDEKKIEKALCRIDIDSNKLVVQFFDKYLTIIPGGVNLIWVREDAPLIGPYIELVFSVPCNELFKNPLNESDIFLMKKCPQREGTILNTFFFKERYTILASVEEDLALNLFELYKGNKKTDYLEIDSYILKRMKDTMPKIHEQMLKYAPQKTWHFYDGYLALIDAFDSTISQNRYPILFYQSTEIIDEISQKRKYKIPHFNFFIQNWNATTRYFLFEEKTYLNGEVSFNLYNTL